MISTRSVRLISVLFLSTMLLAACGGSSTAAASDWSNATSAEAGGGMDALVAAAQAEGELNVIALPEDWCNYGDMIATFEDKYGIQVNSITPEAGSADEVQAIIDNKENKGPQAPDVIDVGPAYGPSSKDQNLLAPYKVCHLG